MTESELILEAYKITGNFNPSKHCKSGDVGAALITAGGHLYTGICVDCACSIGFCAEHAAIAEMLKNKESEIRMIVAVNYYKKIIPPCGRCRELMYQVNSQNLSTKIILGDSKIVSLDELLNYRWQECWK